MIVNITTLDGRVIVTCTCMKGKHILDRANLNKMCIFVILPVFNTPFIFVLLHFWLLSTAQLTRKGVSLNNDIVFSFIRGVWALVCNGLKL